MKKKITTLLLVLFATANIYSQNYNINFSAIGAATTVDSVKVDNLTQNISLKMSGTDILHLGDVGINEFEVNKNNLKIYPNPMYGTAELMFYADKEGDVLVNVFDIRGLEILKYAHNAEKGVHKFQLNGLKQGMYFVNVRSELYSYSLKLISQNTNQSNLATISYLGFENAEKEIVKLKNTYNTVNMPYTDDDLLLFRGESEIYANIVTDVPASNKTITFNFTACIDGDSNNYATVDIGNQIWMAENLRTTRYKNSIVIPNVIDNSAWAALSTDARCYYNNDSAMYSNTYGILYNWYSVNTENICPDDWHVPAISEWTILENYLGGDTLAGGKLKETGIINWLSPNIGASNKSGFTALPGGCRIYNGNYIISGSNSFFWSSTEIETNNAWYIGLEYGNSFLKIYNLNNNNGFSVRCIKDLGIQIGFPTINTKTPTLITSSTATSGGNILSDGGDSVTVRGICWSTSPNPTVLNNKTIDGSGVGSFISNISGLTPNTTYYVRAYAANSIGTAYGNQVIFTSINPTIPTITTNTVNSITQTTATSGGNITSDGGAIIYERGVCWSTSPNPTVLNNKTTDGSGVGSFTSNISGLTPNTTYYVRAYATNSAGTSYGNEISFTSLNPTMPTITTHTVFFITQTTATSGGNIAFDGGAAIIERGVCWSTTPNPTVFNFKTTQGSGVGSFTCNFSGLTPYTTYYVRAYAINSAGTAYGNENSFTTHFPTIPTITTNTVDSITQTTATSGGNITSDGGSVVTARGVCWSTTPNPTVFNFKSTQGSGIGSFINIISGLTPNITYYIRAYAINNAGTAYGNEISFTTLTHIYPVYDIDSNGYDTVHLGTQIWLKQNLNTTHYKNGSVIPNITDSAAWSGMSTGARCYYNNDSATYSATYGALYNWYVVNSGNLCPTGWHVPTNTEWTTLTAYLGGVVIAGSELKATTFWNSPNTGATNSSGFTALPGGSRYFNDYYLVGYYGFWWCSTGFEFNTTDAWCTNMVANSSYVNYFCNDKHFGYSVRCLKDMGAQACLPTVTTSTTTTITATTANSGGNITFDGGSVVTARGVCWSTTPNPTVFNLITTQGSGVGSFISNISGLTPNTTYYVRAYATNSAGTAYGNEISFATLIPSIPTITTNTVNSITQTTATSGGIITSDGGVAISERGICWSTTPNPTILNNKTTNGSGFGFFTSNILGLIPNTTYYVRAYATNTACTAYGNQVIFTTLNLTIPTISTLSVSNISQTTATSVGNITSDGGAAVIARGVCWSISPNPTIADYNTIDGNGIGSFTSIISGLTTGVTYFVRAYATNSVGTAYGNEISFTKIPYIYPVYDIDSNGYDTVQIGTQVWLKQNLRTTRYKDGSSIVYPGSNNNAWNFNNSGAYAWYNNDSATYAATYGALYNAYAAISEKLCPAGWHVPSETEWDNLINYLGGDSVAGGMLKATGTIANGNGLWQSPNTGASNITGFNAFPAGNLYNGSYSSLGFATEYWSTDEMYWTHGIYKRITKRLNYNNKGMSKSYSEINEGNSVRCLKGDRATVSTDTILGVTYNSAIIGGSIISDGGVSITAKGVCWSTSPNPKLPLCAKSTDSTVAGSYITNLNYLAANTTYYVRAYATNGIGTFYGNELIFTTLPHIYPVYDIDSNGYDTVQIGTQIWLKQNLITSRYNNGNSIPYLSTKTDWFNTTIGARCYYDNDSVKYSKTFGALYNWYSVNTSILCPVGWYVPTDADWTTLTNYLGGENIAGAKLKSTSLWYNTYSSTTQIYETDETGFSAFSGGHRENYYSSFYGLGEQGNWWSTTEYDFYNAWYRNMNSYSTHVSKDNLNKNLGNSVRCLKGDLATITTDTISNLTYNSAKSGGIIINAGGLSVTARGVCWSTSPNPTILNNKTTDSVGIGIYTSNVLGLIPNTTYYLKAYATNSAGTSYGNEFSFTTLPHIYPVYDIDGNGYDTVHIGTQAWLKQNLKTTHYKNGTLIPNVTDGAAWEGLNTGARCYYNNDSAAYAATYGALYNWHTVSANNLCPTGWHVPGQLDWYKLIIYLGDEYIAGGKLKEAGLNHWNSPNTAATNSSGFTALSGGMRDGYGAGFNYFGSKGFWSFSDREHHYLHIRYESGSAVEQDASDKNKGLSVRCLMDFGVNVNIPVINTSTVTSINHASAVSGGNISSDGGNSITSRGICWSTSPDPTIALFTKTNDGSGIGSFSSNIFGLIANKTYYVRSYATNDHGTVYGNQQIFTTPFYNYPVYDIDSNGYDTVHIGTQIWFKHNLNTSKYNNGIEIEFITNNDNWFNDTIGAYRWFKNDSTNYASIYGKLYNWYTIKNANLCPIEWHVPTENEWASLINYVGGVDNATKLKSTILWGNYYSNSNETGFSALPSGNYIANGGYFSQHSGNWWSSASYSSSAAIMMELEYDDNNIDLGHFNKNIGFSVRCLKGDLVDQSSLPTVTTAPITSPTYTTAISGGYICSDGGTPVIARGVCWSTSPYPTIDLSTKTINSIDTGSFISNINGLIHNEYYFVRAYATNSAGTAYGNQISFATKSYPVYDNDFNGYDTVHIGTQVWMKQNLKTSKYNNGTTIPNITDNAIWTGLSTGGRAYYNNDSVANADTYGALYNWYAVNTGNLCPFGWHVPTDNEWTALVNYLGGTSIAGGKLKEAGLTHWNSPNTGATNSSGFTALPGGYRLTSGTYNFKGVLGYWWTSTESSILDAYRWKMNFDDSSIGKTASTKQFGFSVRCIKN